MQEVRRSTLLAAMWSARGNEARIVSDLEAGRLKLTGNFKGREREIAKAAREKRAQKGVK